MSRSNGVFGDNPVRDDFSAASFEIHHRVMKPAVTDELSGLLFEDVKFHFDPIFENFRHARLYFEPVTKTERAFVFDVRCPDVPTEPELDELLHRHPVTPRHLIVTRGKYVIEVTTGVNVLVHVHVIGPHLHFGFKGRSCHSK